MKLAENVWRLDSTKNSAAYLILTSEGYSLIDTGYARYGPALVEELCGLGVASLVRILLTHHDIDHIGNMSLLQRQYGCPVYIHSAEGAYIQGRQRRSGVKALIDRCVKTDVSASLTALQSANFNEICVLHTPGHTPGHSCFIFDGFLFSGDLFRLPKLRLLPSRKRMNWDTALLIDSLGRTMARPFAWVCPAYYPPARRDEIIL